MPQTIGSAAGLVSGQDNAGRSFVTGMTTFSLNTADGGSFTVYCAEPADALAPGVVVIHEMYGVTASMRRACDHLAEQGFRAVCPDLFWRLQPGVELDENAPEDRAMANTLRRRFNETRGVMDLDVTLAWLARHPKGNGRVGVVGYCLGGRLAFLLATRSTPDCVVGYYGSGLETRLEEAPAITHPVMLHIAGRDSYVSPEVQEEIRADLGGIPLVTLHTYPDAEHAFARPGSRHYDPAIANLAEARTLAFLRKHLT